MTDKLRTLLVFVAAPAESDRDRDRRFPAAVADTGEQCRALPMR